MNRFYFVIYFSSPNYSIGMFSSTHKYFKNIISNQLIIVLVRKILFDLHQLKLKYQYFSMTNQKVRQWNKCKLLENKNVFRNGLSPKQQIGELCLAQQTTTPSIQMVRNTELVVVSLVPIKVKDSSTSSSIILLQSEKVKNPIDPLFGIAIFIQSKISQFRDKIQKSN